MRRVIYPKAVGTRLTAEQAKLVEKHARKAKRPVGEYVRNVLAAHLAQLEAATK